MANRNQCICFTGPLQVELQPAEMPTPKADQVLLRTLYSLISTGTELAVLTRTHQGFTDGSAGLASYPHKPGYSGVGRVEAIGSNVTAWSPGDTVFFSARHQRFIAVDQDAPSLLAAPPDVPLQQVPFARLAQIADTSVYVSQTQPGEWVAVQGLGLVGNLASQLFRIEGAQVIGIDPLPLRRRLADDAGIPHTIDPANEDAADAVKRLTGGDGARTVIEATGSPALVNAALGMARPMGKTGTAGEVILLGSTRGRAEVDVYNLIHRSGVCLKGAHASLIPNRPGAGHRTHLRPVLERMLRLIQEKKLRIEHLISQVVPPTQAAQAYDDVRAAQDRTMGVLFDWNGG